MSEALWFVKAILSRLSGRSSEKGNAKKRGDGEALFDMPGAAETHQLPREGSDEAG
jgi:hypothetical protein